MKPICKNHVFRALFGATHRESMRAFILFTLCGGFLAMATNPLGAQPVQTRNLWTYVYEFDPATETFVALSGVTVQAWLALEPPVFQTQQATNNNGRAQLSVPRNQTYFIRVLLPPGGEVPEIPPQTSQPNYTWDPDGGFLTVTVPNSGGPAIEVGNFYVFFDEEEDPNEPYLVRGRVTVVDGNPAWVGEALVYAVEACDQGLEDALALTFTSVTGPGQLSPPGTYQLEFTLLIEEPMTGAIHVKLVPPVLEREISHIEVGSGYTSDGQGCILIPEPGTGWTGADFIIHLVPEEVSVPGVIYVNAANTNATTMDGTAWSKAFTNLSDALGQVGTVLNDPEIEAVMIWMAEGTYPTTSGHLLTLDVSLHGGFAGGEISLEERTGGTTIIDGTGLASGVIHVQGAEVRIESALIRGGRSQRSGGGILAQNAILHLENVTLEDNQSTYAGGGMHLEGSHLEAESVSFIANRASFFGGGLSAVRSTAVLRNTVFQGNGAARFGGGAYHERSTVEYRNNTFLSNSAGTAGEGGAISNDRYSTMRLHNSLLWSNAARRNPQVHSALLSMITVTDTVIQGGFAVGTHVMRTDPLLDGGLVPSSFDATANGGLVPVVAVEPVDRLGNPRLGNSLGAVAPLVGLVPQ